MSRRLRCQGFAITPIVVWDDGELLSPGPALDPVPVPAGDLAAFVAGWPEQFSAFREQMEAADAPPNRATRRTRKERD